MHRIAPVFSLVVALTLAPLAPAAAASEGVSPAPAAVEARWGIRILGIRLTAAGYMMDFRYHVVDAAKAAPLFIRGLKPVLEDETTGSKFIVPVPPKTGALRSTNPPQAGRTYFMFFANPAKFVKPGQPVSITVGDFRVEHLRVMAEDVPFPETPPFDSKRVTVRHAEAQPPASCHDSNGDSVGASSGAQHSAAASGEHEGHGAHVTEAVQERARLVNPHLPNLVLTDQDGANVDVTTLLEGDVPVVLTFLFTTCTTICPVMASTVAAAQRALGPEADRIRFVSVSIDPEHDTPGAMREFLSKHHAKANWRFVTGTWEQSEQLQRAFDVYRGNKMAHPPGYFIRDPKAGEWWRLDGLVGAQVVASEYRRVAGTQHH